MAEAAFVSSASLLSMCLTLALSVLFPLAAWMLLARRKKGLTAAVLAGAVGFVVPQLLIRLPILQVLSLNQGWQAFCADNVVLAYAFYASTAALFETAGRFLSLRGLLHKRLSYDTALGAGIGHGGIESIVLIGIAYVNNIVISLMINAGTFPHTPETQAISSALSQTAPGMFLLAGAERVFTMLFHLMLTTLLCLCLMRKKTGKGLALVFALHFALDFFIPLLHGTGLSLWVIEGVMGLVAISSLGLTIALKPKFLILQAPQDPASQALDEGY